MFSRCVISRAMTRGTAANTEIRSRLIVSDQARRHQSGFKVHLGGKDRTESRDPSFARRRGSAAKCGRYVADERTFRMCRYFCAASSIGPTLASTLPCVCTMPLGSPVVPDVNRICNGVSDESPVIAEASPVGRGSQASPQRLPKMLPIPAPDLYSCSTAANWHPLPPTSAYVGRNPRRKFRASEWSNGTAITPRSMQP